MTVSPVDDAPGRLRTLLSVRGHGSTLHASATPEALAEARTLGPEAAGDAVAALLEAYGPGADPAVAARAADLAHELQLERAVPSLVGCLERLTEYDPVAHAALRALGRLRARATDPLLVAFGRCTSRDARARVAAALATVGLRDGRVRAALGTMLADDATRASALLAAHGDRDAVPELRATLDRLTLPPQGTGELRSCEEIVAVAQAILGMGGKLTSDERTKFERAYSRSDEIWARGGPDVLEDASDPSGG